jgi:hypothetical protein
MKKDKKIMVSEILFLEKSSRLSFVLNQASIQNSHGPEASCS